MSEEKPGGGQWKGSQRSLLGPADQKYSRRIKELIMGWVTLAYRRSEGEWTLEDDSLQPTQEGKEQETKKKGLEISRGVHGQSQDS